jgi:tetratricopeptide (TPR) repeat protein
MNIGNVLSAQGDYKNALDHLEKALKINVKCLGDRHVSVAMTHSNIGTAYQKMGENEKAKFHLTNALEIYFDKLGQFIHTLQKPKMSWVLYGSRVEIEMKPGGIFKMRLMFISRVWVQSIQIR